jgi:hypothetical protein
MGQTTNANTTTSTTPMGMANTPMLMPSNTTANRSVPAPTPTGQTTNANTTTSTMPTGQMMNANTTSTMQHHQIKHEWVNDEHTNAIECGLMPASQHGDNSISVKNTG